MTKILAKGAPTIEAGYADPFPRRFRSAVQPHRIPDMPTSMQDQLVGIVCHALKEVEKGSYSINPGMGKMAEWGRCSDRQARKNFRALKQSGVVVVRSQDDGGHRRTVFEVDFGAVSEFLSGFGFSLSASIAEELGRRARA